MDTTREQWRPVVGYEDTYQVSSTGRVWTNRRTRTLKQQPHIDGYQQVTLCRRGHEKKHFVHHLVLSAFTRPRPAGMQACHNNGDPTDNRVENLRWDTISANQRDRTRHGTRRNPRSHCPYGHEYTTTNIHMRGHRKQCRTCMNSYNRVLPSR